PTGEAVERGTGHDRRAVGLVGDARGGLADGGEVGSVVRSYRHGVNSPLDVRARQFASQFGLRDGIVMKWFGETRESLRRSILLSCSTTMPKPGASWPRSATRRTI